MTALPSVWCGPSPKPERRPIEQSPRLASLGVVPALVWTQMTAVSRGAIDPGFVGLQRQLRAADASGFPDQQNFVDYHAKGQLASPDAAAQRVLDYLERADFGSQPVGDVRDGRRR